MAAIGHCGGRGGKELPVFKRIPFLVFFLSILWIVTAEPCQANYRILIETDQYRLAKYEPRSGAYLGAYVFQDTLIQGNMATFNEITGKNHASFFLYVGYGKPVPTKWLEELKKVGAFAHIAWEPNDGLDVVKDDAYLRSFARDLAAAEMPIFLRFASEMNGSWTAYGGDPKKYIEKWRLVHRVMKEEAPNVIMVWTVFTFPQKTILPFYPGDDYVDWVGVNIYNVVYHNDDLNQPAAHEDPLQLLDYVYNHFSERKPIQISEYGATHYTTTDGKEYVQFAQEKISRLYGNLQTKYPRVKSIYYFNVNNLINAPPGRRINNYCLTDNPQILKTYAELIQSPHFLTSSAKNEEGALSRELMLVQKPAYIVNGSTYLPIQELEKYLHAKITLMNNNRMLKIQKGEQETRLQLSLNPVYRGSPRSLYLPLRPIAEHLGYKVIFNQQEKLITVRKNGP